jgi:glyoxylase-like metal-dependent hydrolase (beta-lactamase superfamily II)
MTLEHPWTRPPSPGSVVPVAPGIAWLRMPLPFQLNHINLWLLEDDAGWTVVDTGVGLDDTRALWERVAAYLGGRPITRVVVTHFHPDHMGNAAWLTERWPADLWCTQAEWLAAQYAWRAREPRDLERRLEHYRRHGCGGEALERLRRRGNHYPGLVPSLTPSFRAIADGEELAIGGRRWRVLAVHGHAPEHACLYGPEAGVLISGDQVLPKITTNVSVWPEQPRANPLRLYLDSLARFDPLPEATLVLPSHGLPFRGLHARLARLREHHAERLAETLDALVEPRTAAEVVPVLFRRELDTHQLAFAVGETLAHLAYLEAESRAVRMVGEDGVHRFRKA